METLYRQLSSDCEKGILIVCDPLQDTDLALPGAVIEAERISKLSAGRVPCEVLVSKDSTIKKVSRYATHKQFLHFACHGSFGKGALEPGRLFLAPSAGEKVDSGVLTSGKVIENLNLSGTELVNLAACETALVQPEEGAEISGLTRAFLCAGAKSVIASLWPLHDDAACNFSECFYKNLFKAKDAGVALWQTQITCIRGQLGREMTHPSNWASYVLIGAPYGASSKKGNTESNAEQAKK